MKKEYLNIHIRIEDTDRNKKVLNYFTKKVETSAETKGAWFMKVVYKYYLMEQKKKLSNNNKTDFGNGKNNNIIKKVKKLFN